MTWRHWASSSICIAGKKVEVEKLNKIDQLDKFGFIPNTLPVEPNSNQSKVEFGAKDKIGKAFISNAPAAK